MTLFVEGGGSAISRRYVLSAALSRARAAPRRAASAVPRDHEWFEARAPRCVPATACGGGAGDVGASVGDARADQSQAEQDGDRPYCPETHRRRLLHDSPPNRRLEDAADRGQSGPDLMLPVTLSSSSR